MFEEELKISNQELTEVSNLVSTILDIEGEVESIENLLKDRKEILTIIRSSKNKHF